MNHAFGQLIDPECDPVNIGDIKLLLDWTAEEVLENDGILVNHRFQITL